MLAFVATVGLLAIFAVVSFLARNAVVTSESDQVGTGDEDTPDLTVAIAMTAINMIQVPSRHASHACLVT